MSQCDLAKAKDLMQKRKSGEPLEKKLKGLPTPSRSQMCSSKEEVELLTKVLRKVLYSDNEVQKMLNAKSFVIIVKAPDRQAELFDHMQMWQDMRPEVNQEMKERKEFPQHPLGEKMSYMHMIMMNILKEEFEKDPEKQDTANAIAEIEKMDRGSMDKMITTMAPKHKTPKENRPWVWTVMWSDVMTEEYKVQWRKVIGKQTNSLKIDIRQGGQDKLTEELWEELKKRTPVKM